MKKIILIFAVLLGIAGIWIFLQKDQFVVPPVKSLSSEKIEIKEQNKEARYSIEVSYPVFSKINDEKSKQNLNDLIKQKTLKQINSFKQGVSNLDLSFLPQEFSSDLFITYEIAKSTTRLVSVDFTVSQYWAGAAHPNSVANTFNYDVARKKELALSDVFKKDSDYLKVLSDISIKTLMKRLGKELAETDDAVFMKDWIKTGAGPKKENYSNFLLGNKNFVIIFDPYQVGPYAWGFQRVEIPYKKLQSVLAIDPSNF